MALDGKPPIHWKALLDWLPWSSRKSSSKDLKVGQIYRQQAQAPHSLSRGRWFWADIWYKTENQCLKCAKANLNNPNLPVEHPLKIDPWMKVFASAKEFHVLSARFGQEFTSYLHSSAYNPYDKIPEVCGKYLKELAILASPVKDAAGFGNSISQDDLTPLLILLLVKCEDPKLISDKTIKRLFASIDTAENSPFMVKTGVYEKAIETLLSNTHASQAYLLAHKFDCDANQVQAFAAEGKLEEARTYLENQKHNLFAKTGPVTSVFSAVSILRGIDTKRILEIGEKYSRPSSHPSLFEKLGISQVFSKLLRHS